MLLQVELAIGPSWSSIAAAASGDKGVGDARDVSGEMTFGRKQVPHIDSKELREKLNLLVADDAPPGFDVGEDVARHVAAEPLQLRDGILLRPAAPIAQSGDRRSNDIRVMTAVHEHLCFLRTVFHASTGGMVWGCNWNGRTPP